MKKIKIDPDLSIADIMAMGASRSTAYRAKKKGYFYPGAGNPGKRRKRFKTTVSLWLEVWKLAEEIGGTRGRGLEAMAEFWSENHSNSGELEQEEKL